MRIRKGLERFSRRLSIIRFEKIPLSMQFCEKLFFPYEPLYGNKVGVHHYLNLIRLISSAQPSFTLASEEASTTSPYEYVPSLIEARKHLLC